MNNDVYIKYLDYLKNYLKDFLKNNKIKNVIIGISGGIDSILTLKILSLVLDAKNIYPYFINVEKKLTDKFLKSEEYLKSLSIKINLIDIYNEFESLSNKIEIIDKNNLGNLKARLRMSILYSKAFEKNGIVIGTTNYTEAYLGYFTKHGDNAVDLQMLSGLLKEDIYKLASIVNIPDFFIKQAPSADLYLDQTDEKELDISYLIIDSFLNDKDILKDDMEKIVNIHKKNNHKLFFPISPKVIKNRKKIL